MRKIYVLHETYFCRINSFLIIHTIPFISKTFEHFINIILLSEKSKCTNTKIFSSRNHMDPRNGILCGKWCWSHQSSNTTQWSIHIFGVGYLLKCFYMLLNIFISAIVGQVNMLQSRWILVRNYRFHSIWNFKAD